MCVRQVVLDSWFPLNLVNELELPLDGAAVARRRVHLVTNEIGTPDPN